AAKQIILETSVSLNDHTLTLAERQTITLSSLDENLPFFTDISQLIIDGEQIAEGTDLGEYLVFVSPDNKEYTNISFIYQNNSIMAASIPEPTTATLSLLALAAIATRRRRAAAKASA
ncbi:MAG: PEP-CTERM sorting domain-containing protein, partial [Akkermansia sp.]|nr:PEP-CTERM sorting domain-containing protein [Akkermansia sp.]